MSQGLFEANPFHVLGLDRAARSVEVERAGRRLLAMLELGLAGARTYDTPLGAVPLTPEAVRNAMADLRTPDRRVIAEVTAVLPTCSTFPGRSLPAWTGAGRALGWRLPFRS